MTASRSSTGLSNRTSLRTDGVDLVPWRSDIDDATVADGVDDLARLPELEAVIERGLATFIEVGKALMEIQDGRLYRETHATFEDYCRQRWEMSRVHAHRTKLNSLRVSPLTARDLWWRGLSLSWLIRFSQ